MQETNIVYLADGRTVVLDDEEDLILSLISNNKTEDTWTLPYPPGGYGGGALRISPSERYLIFSYFSGESEEAFALFEIENGRLKFLYNSGYLYGEEASYSFVNDEEIIVQTFRTGAWYKENAKTDENGEVYYEFGELNLFDIEAQELHRHIIHVYPSEDWEEEETDVGSFMFSENHDGQYHVIVPWGKALFSEPLEDILVVRTKQ
ncbi:MAG: hypothetical protein K2L86_13935 [Lachnospiraceae bacterium]|nr:hypothetical protein [Lachnospiraceae bacterium]